jgi:hypothetical protein
MTEPRFNAVKHGCCARSPLLPGEDEAVWREVEQDWFTDYNPQTATSRAFVAEAALAFWTKARCRRHLEQVEFSLSHKNALDWTNEDHQQYSRFLRYKTAADRSFSRAFQDLEYLRKARLSEQEALRRTEERLEKLQLDLAREQAKLELAHAKQKLDEQKHADSQRHKELDRELKAKQLSTPMPKSASSTGKKPKKEPFGTAEQWLEVTITDGLTTTTYIPTNEELLEEIETAIEEGEAEPQMVYRRMNFPDGVPPEYAWTNLHQPEHCEQTRSGVWCPLCQVAERGGHGIQRLTYPTWREVIEREQHTPGHHAGPTGVGNLPTPKERGGELSFPELLQLEQRQRELRSKLPEEVPPPESH